MSEFNTAALLLSTAGGIIVLLLAVIGFFLRPFLKAIDQLKDTVNNLRLIVELQKQDSITSNKLCDMKHSIIENRLNNLETED